MVPAALTHAYTYTKTHTSTHTGAPTHIYTHTHNYACMHTWMDGYIGRYTHMGPHREQKHTRGSTSWFPAIGRSQLPETRRWRRSWVSKQRRGIGNGGSSRDSLPSYRQEVGRSRDSAQHNQKGTFVCANDQTSKQAKEQASK
eukprot:GHVU01008205.1.p3 GENE.GHVU01008205.1~~GHVU01008205.1.p3  ORF type:complete len:143 (+),score=13.63 GHVU01008205.1:511-939(+)